MDAVDAAERQRVLLIGLVSAFDRAIRARLADMSNVCIIMKLKLNHIPAAQRTFSAAITEVNDLAISM